MWYFVFVWKEDMEKNLITQNHSWTQEENV